MIEPAQATAPGWSPPWLGDVGVVIALGLLVLVSALAMNFPDNVASDRGPSIADFEYAGSSAEADRILSEWGEAGKVAAWWQLGLDLPFLLGYGLLLCAGCVFAAGRLGEAGLPRLSALAAGAALLGPLAAVFDLVQNSALAFVLAGHTGQPTPRVAEVFGYATFAAGILAGAVFVCGWAAAAMTRSGALR